VDVLLGERPNGQTATVPAQQEGQLNARAAIAIAEEEVRSQLDSAITEKVATPDEVDGQDVWIVELNTETQTATVVVSALDGTILDVTIE
jgi:acetylornithine deacetylase/succinyl-diaminopimelate desuccinylase-like protein